MRTTERRLLFFENMPPGADRRRMAELLHLNDVPMYLGASGSVSVVTYKYLDAAELKDSSEKKTDFTVSGQAGFFTPMLGFLIGTVGYQQISAAGADAVSLCRPLAETDATSCANAVLKPPKESKGGLATFKMHVSSEEALRLPRPSSASLGRTTT